MESAAPLCARGEAPLFGGADPRLLRLRFWRAPPPVVHSTGDGATVAFTVALTDEHGDDACFDGADIECFVVSTDDAVVHADELDAGAAIGAVAPRHSKDGAFMRWQCAAPTAKLARHARVEGDGRRFVHVLARARRAHALDTFAVCSGPIQVVVGAEASPANALPMLLHSRAFWGVQICEEYGTALGSHVWNGSVVLGAFLLEHRAFEPSLRVVELGAGCGLAGILAAKMGARVALTERDDDLALQSTRRNAELNAWRLGLDIEVATLDFANPAASTAVAEATLGLAADVLYSPQNARAFAALLLRPDVLPALDELLLAHTRRSTSDKDSLETFLDAVKPRFPDVSLVARARNVSIYRMLLRQDA